ncbi:MAG: hypothetical protein NZM29_06690 [Nitrospira sp.]|nr:hypothetical protein [Nitrospira sp.]
MKQTCGILGLCLLFTVSSGCSYLFYPRAAEYAQQARGATVVETMSNLTTMLEASATNAKGGTGKDLALDSYHNQLHALFDAVDEAVATQVKPPASDRLLTHKKTLRLLFHRLWTLKDQQPQRDYHLDLCLGELKRLRETLQTLK